MTSQGTAHGRFQRAIRDRHLRRATMAARELGHLSLDDALALCELIADFDPSRFDRAALRWLQRFIEERSPPLAEVGLAVSALNELEDSAVGGRSDSCRLSLSVECLRCR
jgi:hypothetical protein